MKLHSITLSQVSIPLRLQFAQANSSARHSNSVLIKVETATGVSGYGEACPRTYVTGEDVESVFADLTGLQSLLYEYEFAEPADIQALVCYELPRHAGPAAVCALELALLDALAKENNRSVCQLLGHALPEELAYAGVVPFGKIESLRPVLSRFRFQEVKFKATGNLPESLDRVAQLQDIYGPHVRIRLDANCGWTLAEARQHIPALTDAGVIAFEQIFPANDLENLGKITREFGARVSIMADESICTYEQAAYLAENSLCNHFNLKLSKNGGIYNCLRILDLARQHGIRCQLGAHYGETSILTAAGVALSAAAPQLTAREGALGTWLLQQDICKPSLQIDRAGLLRPGQDMQGHGLGMDFADDRIASFQKKTAGSHRMSFIPS